MSMLKIKKFQVVVCRVGEHPVAEIISGSAESVAETFYDAASPVVGGSLEQIRYPQYLGRKHTVVVNEQGLLLPLPCNRWGLRGNFLVCRITANGVHRDLTDAEVQQIIHDLEHEDGYLNPESGVALAIGIRFASRHSVPAPEFQSRGNEWSPDLHFTGMYVPDEINFIEWLLERYSANVVAHYIYMPFPKSYSVELQFGTSEEDHAKMLDCRKAYHAAFDPKGRLKPAAAEMALASVQEAKH